MSITDTFTMDCPSCGPGTIRYVDGEIVPHGCDYEPPAIVIDCTQPLTCQDCGHHHATPWEAIACDELTYARRRRHAARHARRKAPDG